MEFKISDAAFDFFKTIETKDGEGVRIKGKQVFDDVTDDDTNVHDGFTVAIEPATPKEPIVEAEKDGVLVFGEKEDEWFLSRYNLEIDFDKEKEEPIYTFNPTQEEQKKQDENDDVADNVEKEK